MKKIVLLSSIFSVLSFSGLIYYGFCTYTQKAIEIDTGLNTLYALILFISFLSLRVSLIDSKKIDIRVGLFTLMTICVGTISWMFSTLLSEMASISMVLIFFMIGSSIMTHLKGKNKFIKLVKAIFMGTLMFLAVILLLVDASPFLFQLAFILLGTSTLGLMVALATNQRAN